MPDSPLRPEDIVARYPSIAAHSEGFAARATERLATVRDPPRDRPASPRTGLSLHDRPPIGEGGMGVVRLATQESLQRVVAIKCLRPSDASAATTGALLREAWVTGSLEHPSIVPVYDLADVEGLPAIVMKRIEGVDWLTLMNDPDAIAERVGERDATTSNLRVFLQVTHAVSFAHSRGIVHRDIKPENVMVGAFGEVTLVDWGLAVATHDDGSGRYPLATDAREVAGTPAYMAPEMLGGGAPIGPATDVYLLGATLYEIATGRPPHAGDTMAEVVTSILQSPPPVGGHVDGELRTILARAMAHDPGERHTSVDELRRAVLTFMSHRGAAAVTRRAEALLADLELAAKTAANKVPSADALRFADALFHECRFAFRYALESWPSSPRAHAGLARAHIAIARILLRGGQPEAALRLLRDAQGADAAEIQAMGEAARAAIEERDALLREARVNDPAIGRISRLGVAMRVAALVGAAHVGMYASGYELRYALQVVFPLSVSAWLLLRASRADVASARISTLNFRFLALAFGLQAALAIGAIGLGLSSETSLQVTAFQWAACCLVAGVLLTWRYAVAGAIILAGFAAMVLAPERTTAIIGGTYLAASVAVFFMRRALIVRQRSGTPAGSED